MKKILFAIAIVFFSVAGSAKTISLAWDASPSAGVTGYVVYAGKTPSIYDLAVNAGNVLAYSYDVPDEYHYWAVTAYNATGLESGYSNEVNDLNRPEAPGGLKFIIISVMAGIGILWLILFLFSRKKKDSA